MLATIRMLTMVSDLGAMVTCYSRCYTATVLTEIRFSVAAAFLLCFAITIGLCFYIVILWHTIHSISMWHFSITMDIGPMNLYVQL